MHPNIPSKHQKRNVDGKNTVEEVKQLSCHWIGFFSLSPNRKFANLIYLAICDCHSFYACSLLPPCKLSNNQDKMLLEEN